ncbi:BON domain-containing protein [Acidovorax sp.]|uniref:BON domain-containing protein n=1 Tax=Acidovorax sp. TaxID=1872122 RepID=UPI00263911EF|nr:BON domain-containing protein [Acidovorax sp.]
MNALTSIDRPTHRVASILAVSALALGLAACGKTEEPTVGQKLDSAIEKTEQTAADARAKAESVMQSAEKKVEDGAATAEATAQQAAQQAKGAVDDTAITAQIVAGLAKDADLSAIKISVDTVGGKVTLKGPAPSAAAKDRAEALVKAISGVVSVDNQLVAPAG